MCFVTDVVLLRHCQTGDSFITVLLSTETLWIGESVTKVGLGSPTVTPAAETVKELTAFSGGALNTGGVVPVGTIPSA